MPTSGAVARPRRLARRHLVVAPPVTVESNLNQLRCERLARLHLRAPHGNGLHADHRAERSQGATTDCCRLREDDLPAAVPRLRRFSRSSVGRVWKRSGQRIPGHTVAAGAVANLRYRLYRGVVAPPRYGLRAGVVPQGRRADSCQTPSTISTCSLGTPRRSTRMRRPWNCRRQASKAA